MNSQAKKALLVAILFSVPATNASDFSPATRWFSGWTSTSTKLAGVVGALALVAGSYWFYKSRQKAATTSESDCKQRTADRASMPPLSERSILLKSVMQLGAECGYSAGLAASQFEEIRTDIPEDQFRQVLQKELLVSNRTIIDQWKKRIKDGATAHGEFLDPSQAYEFICTLPGLSPNKFCVIPDITRYTNSLVDQDILSVTMIAHGVKDPKPMIEGMQKALKKLRTKDGSSYSFIVANITPRERGHYVWIGARRYDGVTYWYLADGMYDGSPDTLETLRIMNDRPLAEKLLPYVVRLVEGTNNHGNRKQVDLGAEIREGNWLTDLLLQKQ